MEVLNKIFKEFGIEREIEKDIEINSVLSYS